MNRLSRQHTGRFLLGAFWMDFAGGLYVVALPYFAMSLGAGSLELGIIGTARGMAYMVASVGAALIADRYSRRGLAIIATLAMTIMLALNARASSLWQIGAYAMA